MRRSDDVLAVLKVVHSTSRSSRRGMQPCETMALANALDLEPQEVADRLCDAEKRRP